MIEAVGKLPAKPSSTSLRLERCQEQHSRGFSSGTYKHNAPARVSGGRTGHTRWRVVLVVCCMCRSKTRFGVTNRERGFTFAGLCKTGTQRRKPPVLTIVGGPLTATTGCLGPALLILQLPLDYLIHTRRIDNEHFGIIDHEWGRPGSSIIAVADIEEE